MIAGLLIGTAKTMVISLLSEKLILKVTLELLKWAVSKSTNKVDDKVVSLMEEQLRKGGQI
tara:strand:+ start:506 stop:688 length:183 start_codon:yes stop_codon:yes gene_type:complete